MRLVPHSSCQMPRITFLIHLIRLHFDLLLPVQVTRGWLQRRLVFRVTLQIFESPLLGATGFLLLLLLGI